MKNINKYLLAILASSILFACNGSNNSGQNSSSLPKDVEPGNKIESVDLLSLNYGVDGQQKLQDVPQRCSESNDVCVQAKSLPSASYVLDMTGNPSWVVKDVVFGLKVTFNKDIAANNFKLLTFYNNLESSDAIAGRITQIDTSACDQLFANPKAGKSCVISLAYSGENADNTTNDIHFTFGWGNLSDPVLNPVNYLDYSIPVKNQEASNLNIPAFSLTNDPDILAIDVSAQELLDHTGIGIDKTVDNQIFLQNMGTGTATAEAKITGGFFPTITAAFGSQFGGQSINDLYFETLAVTTCGYLDVAPLNSCNFPFSFIPTTNSNGFEGSVTGRFVFTYFNGLQDVNYSKRFLLTHGLFSYNQDIVNLGTQAESDYTLSRVNPGNNYVAYSPKVKNLKVYLASNPEFNIASLIGTQINGKSVLRYSYGTFGKKNISDVLDYINANAIDTSGCTSQDDGFESSGMIDNRDCKIHIDTSKIASALLNIKKDNGVPESSILELASAEVHVSYCSSVDDGRCFDQIVGSVNLVGKESIPIISQKPQIFGGKILFNNGRDFQKIKEFTATVGLSQGNHTSTHFNSLGQLFATKQGSILGFGYDIGTSLYYAATNHINAKDDSGCSNTSSTQFQCPVSLDFLQYQGDSLKCNIYLGIKTVQVQIPDYTNTHFITVNQTLPTGDYNLSCQNDESVLGAILINDPAVYGFEYINALYDF